MTGRRLPLDPVPLTGQPVTVDRGAWQQELAKLLVLEKAHTRAGDALAAARRRLPMTPIAADATVVGPQGDTPIHEVFEGRRLLLAYYHMWHDHRPWPHQCEGCTFAAAQLQRQEYLNARDITVAIFSEGTYDESRPYADFLNYDTPWYSARDSSALVAGREFGFIACYLRDDHNRVFETYWTTDRGVEAALWSYALMDLTVFGRQERWQDGPSGWPVVPKGQHPWRIDGRPIAQWTVTDEAVDVTSSSCCERQA